MRIRVYMRDGRTCYRLAKRSQLGDLVQREPAEDKHRSVDAEFAVWDHEQRIYTFIPIRLRYIGKGSISCVEEDPQQGGDAT